MLAVFLASRAEGEFTRRGETGMLLVPSGERLFIDLPLKRMDLVSKPESGILPSRRTGELCASVAG